jgi:hypothetical protein
VVKKLESGKLFAILGGIITLLGTYVFAIYQFGTAVGSGLGFLFNLIGFGLIPTSLFTGADSYAVSISMPIWLYWIVVIIFLVFLVAGLLQILAMKSKALSFLFSLFPLGVGLMFIFLQYTDFLGVRSAFFGLFFIGEHIGDFYPILLNLGDLALGTYLLLGGGVLGFVSVFLPHD